MDYVKWLRPKIGNMKVFLPCANCVIFNEAGEILLMQRRDFGSWATPGGALDIGETMEACVRREVREETGLEIDQIELASILSEPRYDVTYPNGDQTQQYTVNFRAVAAGGALQKVDGEALDLRWFRQDALPDNMLPWFKVMITAACAENRPILTPPESRAKTREQWVELRKKVGQERILGVGAMVMVVHEGRILMTRRTDTGNWWFPAGFQMFGENIANTAEREVREETGLHIKVTRFFGIITSPHYQSTYPNGDAVQHVSAIFRANLTGGELTPQTSEVSELAWMTPEEIRSELTHGRYPFVVAPILAHLDAGSFFI